MPPLPRSTSVSAGKGGSFWSRRLKPKGSSAALVAGKSGGAAGTATATMPESTGGGKDGDGNNGVPSLPMTANPTSRPPKRDVASVTFGGPNANYMAALARLCDAAQVVGEFFFAFSFVSFFAGCPCPSFPQFHSDAGKEKENAGGDRCYRHG